MNFWPFKKTQKISLNANKMVDDEIKKQVREEIVAFLNKRGKILYDLGGVHFREGLALIEAALMIERGQIYVDQICE